MANEWWIVWIFIMFVVILLLIQGVTQRNNIEFSSPSGFTRIQCPNGVINASNFTGNYPLCFTLNDKLYDAQALSGLGCIDTVYYVNATGYKLVLLNSTEAMNTLEKANVSNSSICSALKESKK